MKSFLKRQFTQPQPFYFEATSPGVVLATSLTPYMVSSPAHSRQHLCIPLEETTHVHAENQHHSTRILHFKEYSKSQSVSYQETKRKVYRNGTYMKSTFQDWLIHDLSSPNPFLDRELNVLVV